MVPHELTKLIRGEPQEECINSRHFPKTPFRVKKIVDKLLLLGHCHRGDR
ncbi:hypothetical protein Pla52o_39340 [Novipirellula galeiformis]|uniref:Uncharacterized protein n=1 Tax=Novipirellula galeiformis TaxID=2528004 RepID=A0A5C6CDD2_9BACT|nr:hypothetical protein Pla52o_39340 [Novipirellula galeiformis]